MVERFLCSLAPLAALLLALAIACGVPDALGTTPPEATVTPTNMNEPQPTEAMTPELTEVVTPVSTEVTVPEPTDVTEPEPTDVTEPDPTDEAETESYYGGALRVAYPIDHSTLDPVQAEAVIITDAVGQIFEPLVRIAPDASYVPILATAWEISDDLMSYTFTLREGVKFHNGADFTADDVVFSLNRARDPDISSQAALFGSVDDIVAVDDYAVRIDHDVPNGLFLDVLQLLPSAILDADTDLDKLAVGEEAYGTGPFMLEELLPEERVTMVRNPDYWDRGLPYLDELVFVGIAERSARREALLDGDVDVLPGVEPKEVDAISAGPYTQVHSVVSSSWIGIAINNLIPPFDDKLVRQALRYAIDRDLVNQMAFLGLGAPNNDSPFWPGDSRFYAPEYEVEYDPEKARQLLAEAGYSDGIDITIATADLDPGMIELPAAFKQSAAAAGIRVDIKSHSSAQFWSQIYPYGPLTVFWNLVRPHPDHSLTIIFHSGSRWNTTYFGKQLVEGAEFAPFDREIFTVGPLAQELDALIERARGESLEQQKVTYREIQAFLAEQVPQLVIASRPKIAGAGNHVQGLALSPLSPNYYYETVWLEQ